MHLFQPLSREWGSSTTSALESPRASCGSLSEGVHECEENEHNMCDVCDKFFVDENNYKRHEKGMKVCRFCPEKFCTSRALGAHINSKHTFIHCEFCGQEFSKRSNLDCHLRMRTSKPKVCQVCGSVFCNYGTLSSHMIMDHHSKNMK